MGEEGAHFLSQWIHKLFYEGTKVIKYDTMGLINHDTKTLENGLEIKDTCGHLCSAQYVTLVVVSGALVFEYVPLVTLHDILVFAKLIEVLFQGFSVDFFDDLETFLHLHPRQYADRKGERLQVRLKSNLNLMELVSHIRASHRLQDLILGARLLLKKCVCSVDDFLEQCQSLLVRYLDAVAFCVVDGL